MPGDYSRKIFRPKKHYSGVLMQQGRVQLDADFNEQLDIASHRTQIEAIDVIGQSGVPKKNDGFKVGVSANKHNLTIAKGRIYVEGLLCELEEGTTYTSQTYLPNPDFTGPASPPSSPPQTNLDLDDGVYLVLLDAWQREISALDDPLIREVALGGPDTTTRLQNIWQVKLLEVGETSPPQTVACDTAIPAFDDLTAPSTGMLNARTQPPKPEDNPCLLPAQTGYTRLENQLYRVEVQQGGPRSQVTFKWSRDNASVETKINNVSNKVLTVADTGKDKLLSFAGGQWVEIVDNESTLKGTTRALFQIDKVDKDTNKITLKTSAAAFASLEGKKLRRWDQNETNSANADGVAATASWIELENGIQVRFSDGDYHTGDYWLIPARTATGEIEWPPYEIPNNNPEPQPPRGIRHYFCRLALVRSQAGELTVIGDCRKRFPPLTGICAEDICFDNETCDFAGAETVQDALDKLCAARDLRFHNKHLHGWGIVCGLQVECGANTNVRVRPGYAITCEGEDVILKGVEDVNLLDLMTQPEAGSPPETLKDGEVCLVLEPHQSGNRRFRLEPFKAPKNKLDVLLNGTIWQDVIDDCLQPLIDLAKEQFTTKPEEGKLLVGPTQKRVTTFSNLLIQLVNKQNGSFVFLSGGDAPAENAKDLRTEDAILRAFYKKLRERLQSHTFCAMFENARPFPDYPEAYASLKIATIFGKGFQKRFRVSPNSNIGYSLGAGNKIHVFDLKKNEMAAELEFPGGPTAIVQDVAFSKDGKQLFAVATIKDKDSMFAVADVGSGFKYKWREPTMICDILFKSLGMIAGSKSVFATGKGKGLYEINPAQVNATPDPLYPFNAIGHLEMLDEGSLAFATATNQAGQTTVYNRVLRLNLKTHESVPPAYVPTLGNAQLSGDDDITISSGDDQRLYIVVNPPPGQSTKHVAIFDLKQPQAPIAVRDVKDNTGIRMAFNPTTSHTMLTFDDSYRVGLIGPNNQFLPKYRHPVQIAPGSIATSPDGKRVYVLNYTSNTISSIPAELLDPQRQIPLQPLVDYRAGVLNAFADLLGGLLQYLKDCFCDHFLINCPTCDETDKLYLACITVKNGKVFKVCNFSLRKYVHSFPTIEYWLSVVPVIPMIKMAVEKFCCSVLPGFFGKFQAFKPDTANEVSPAAPNTLKSNQMRSGITFAQQADFQGAFSKVLSSSGSARKLMTDVLTGSASRTLTRAPDTAIHRADIEDKPTEDARKKLAENRIIVDKVEAYDPAKAGRNLLRMTKTPAHLEPGTRVNLITKDDKVMFYTIADEAPTNVEELRAEFENTRAVAVETKAVLDLAMPVFEGLRNQVEVNKSSVAESRAALEKISPQVEALKTRLDADSSTLATHKTAIDSALPRLESFNTDLEKSKAELAANKAALAKLTPQLEDLRTKVASDSAVLAANKETIEKALPRLETLVATVDKSAPEITDLKARLDAAQAALAENKAAVAEALTMRQEVSSLRRELLQVRQTHQQELAARDKDISDLRTNITNSRNLLDNLNERVRRLNP